jgi:hypothetical protein
MAFQSFQSPIVTRRALLPLVLAIAALFAWTRPAGAETTGEEPVDQVSAAVTSTPSTEGSNSAEQPQSVAATPAPESVDVEPVDVEEVTNAGGAIDTATAVESASTAPAPSDPPASIQRSNDTGARSVVTDSAPPVSVRVPTGTELDETIASPAKRRVSGLAESARRDATPTIAAADRSSPAIQVPLPPQLTDGISPLVQSGAEGPLLDAATLERALPTPPLGTLERELLTLARESAAPAMGTLPPAGGTGPETLGGGSSEKARGFSGRSPAGLFSRQPSLFSGVHSIGYSVDAGTLRPEALSASGARGKGRPPATGRVENILLSDHLGTTLEHRSSPSPAPSRLPLPAPESPGGIEGGSGGSFFVPLVALLALLALVAPATLRRRLEVADFPLLTQFVCALERPG